MFFKKIIRTGILLLVVVCMAGVVGAQTLIDIGTAGPVPGPNDVSQLNTNGNQTFPDGLNYYTDNSAPPGQTFLTASNTTGLTSLAIKTAGLNNGNGATNATTTPTYYLRLYSVSGTAATLLATFTAANPGFADGDWLCWSNFAVPLSPNSTYAYSFGRGSAGGYCALAVASGNRYAGGEIALVPTAGGAVTLGGSHGYDAVFDLGLTTNVLSVLTDIGTATPSPGPNDISQLSTSGNQTAPDGLNYYTDNSAPPGQTFTTGASSTNLIALAVKTAGLNSGNGYGTPTTTTNYYLRIYSVSGSMATLVQSYTNLNPGFTDGDWLKWNNLSLPLAANSTYAYSVSRLPSSGGGWCALAVASGNTYSGGQIALIPIAGGTMTFGSSHGFDAVFDLGMFANAPTANTPVVSPKSTVYVGQTVSLAESALGTGTLYYQWQTDGGGGGSLTNIPGATSTNVTATLANTGTYKFTVTVTNSYGSATSSVAAVTVLPPASVTVNVASPMAAMPLQGLGICTATYDGSLIDSRVAPMLSAAGITAVRYPGGSYADIFNWQTTTGNGGAYVNSNDSFDNWMNTVVNPAGAQAIITVNYGSNPSNTAGGDPNVAAAWVNYANNTKHWGIKYWEIGNEVGGNGYYPGQDWEYDLHFTNQTASARVGQVTLSPAAYGTNSAQFINAMKAQDPTILCGVGFSPGNNAYNTPLLQAVGTNADFVIIHWYPGSDNASTLAASAQIPSTVNITLSELTNILGTAHASQMKIAITETGAGNAVGAPVALFAADNYLTWIENGIVNVDFQELHSTPPVFLQGNQQPACGYYGAQMSRLLANVGDKFVTTTSAQSELRVHATTRQDGKTGVMLVNLDPLIAIAVTVNITGTNLASTGTWYQFGLTNISTATTLPAYPVSTNTVTGLVNSFTVLVPPYTMVDLLIPPMPANTPPVLAAIANRTVNVGQTVAFTASATDTDQPPQTLTFRLLAGVTNATLNTNSGAFSWRPLVTQAGTTNAFSLKVADNGSPSLSATQSFSVTVNPLTQPGLSSIGLIGGFVQFQVSGVNGPDYAVQGSSNLLNWNVLFITNSPAMPFLWTDTNTATLPAQFYRIKVGPPLP
jgi:hypothetical protein